MKKTIAIATLCTLSLGASHSTLADNYTEAKKATAFTTTTIAGTVLGGPVGMIVGALAGAYIGETIETAEEVNTMENQLAESHTALRVSEQKNHALAHQLSDAQLAFDELLPVTESALSLPVLFKFGSDQLNYDGQLQTKKLAEFLKNYDQYQVRLNGHTDQLGTEEYNNVLAQARAESIKNSLEILGVNPERITVNVYGSTMAKADKRDIEGRSKERRVEITLIPAESLVMK